MIERPRIDIDVLNETELKALLYEQFCELENTQKNIHIIKARLQYLYEQKSMPLNTNQINTQGFNNIIPFKRT